MYGCKPLFIKIAGSTFMKLLSSIASSIFGLLVLLASECVRYKAHQSQQNGISWSSHGE